MAIATILLLTILMTISTKGVIFIIKYISLSRQGIETEGKIISCEISKSIINKHAAIPKVSFVTTDQTIITNKPVLSWLSSVNDYLYQKKCIICYDPKTPQIFIIKSITELLANGFIIVTTIIIVIYSLSINLD